MTVHTFLGFLLLAALWLGILGPDPAFAENVTPPDAPAAPAKETSRELWTGSLYTSTYRIGMCVESSGALRGVVLLRTLGGQVDVYHVEGQVDGEGNITARHHSGHSFKGRYVGFDEAKGMITLKSGRKITLTAKRDPDARLSEGECRPL